MTPTTIPLAEVPLLATKDKVFYRSNGLIDITKTMKSFVESRKGFGVSTS
jgi:hypothetical protein